MDGYRSNSSSFHTQPCMMVHSPSAIQNETSLKHQSMCEPKNVTQVPQFSDHSNQCNFSVGSTAQHFSQQNQFYGSGSQSMLSNQPHLQNSAASQSSVGWMQETEYYNTQLSYANEDNRAAHYKSFPPQANRGANFKSYSSQYFPPLQQPPNNNCPAYGTENYRSFCTTNSSIHGNISLENSWLRNVGGDYNWENTL